MTTLFKRALSRSSPALTRRGHESALVDFLGWYGAPLDSQSARRAEAPRLSRLFLALVFGEILR